MVSNDWMFVCCFSIFTTIVVIMEHSTVESEKPTISSVNNEISIQKTFDFLQNITLIFPHSQLMDLRIFFPSVNYSVSLIPKNGHSVLRFVNCLLTLQELKNETAYNSFDSLSTMEGAFSPPLPCMPFAAQNDDKKYRKIVFVRDPIKRFISGYLFLCKRQRENSFITLTDRENVCFNCGTDFGCFLKTLYFCWTSKMIDFKICAQSFPNMYIHYHLAPQVNFCKNSDDVKVMQYSKGNINNFLLSAAKPLLAEDKYKKLLQRLNRKTSHAANEQDAEDIEILIRSNRTLTNMFAQLYFMDYKIFKIDIPQFIIDFKLYENVDVNS